MNRKSVRRLFLYGLIVLMLVVNATSVAASPEVGKPSAKVFTVTPSGGDDTANIQHAFDQALAAGPGSTVRLTAGNFTTRFIEVWDFDGYFTGAGQNKTVIDTFADQDCQALVDSNRMPALFSFLRGNVRVSDLGFHITPAKPCAPYLFQGFTPGYMASWIEILSITTSPFVPETDGMVIHKEGVSGSVARVTFRGEQGIPQNGETDPTFSNIGEAIFLGGSFFTNGLVDDTNYNFAYKFARGTFSIVNTTHENIGIGMIVEHTDNSPVVIRGNSFDMGTNGIVLENLSGSRVEISANHIKNGSWSGIWVNQGGATKLPALDTPAVFDIHNNDIEGYETTGWWTSGIIVWDNDNLGNNYFPSTGKTAIVVARNNHITLTPLNPTEYNQTLGVWLEGVDGALVVNNKITGAGTAAIYTGSWGPSQRGILLANDLTGFSAVDGGPYKIVLEWGTEKYIVTGEPVANVANYGTDNLIAGTRFWTRRQSGQEKPDWQQFLENLKNLKGGFLLSQR